MVRLALVSALGVLLLAPQAAAGGGWWSSIQVDSALVAPGDRVELEVAVLFRSTAAAEAAQQPDRFSVYLLRGFDDSVLERAMRKPSPGNWWSLGGAEAIEVGPVSVRISDVNFGKATAAFPLPEVPPATYRLMICAAACTEPLADVIPTDSFTVVADPATARIAERVHRLERRSGQQARQLAAAARRTDRALVVARDARSDVERLQTRVATLATESRKAPAAPWWAYVGWLLAGALALFVVRRRRADLPASSIGTPATRSFEIA